MSRSGLQERLEVDIMFGCLMSAALVAFSSFAYGDILFSRMHPSDVIVPHVHTCVFISV